MTNPTPAPAPKKPAPAPTSETPGTRDAGVGDPSDASDPRNAPPSAPIARPDPSKPYPTDAPLTPNPQAKE